MTADLPAMPLLLGQVAGAYSERAPLGSLKSHFACAWLNRMPPGEARSLAIPPDGSIDLQWVDGVLRIAGPDRHAKIERLAAGATVIGLRFQPGSAAAWLGVLASEIVNERLPLEVFWGSEARRLADRVGEARSVEDAARRLEAAMAAKAAAMPDLPNGEARLILRLLRAHRPPGTEIVGMLSRRLGLSERTLRRKCHAAFGYGPKTLDRILRFQRFLRMARSADPVGLVRLAGEAGYADQAHLSREARRMAGLSPTEILVQLKG